jgi:hypothetical protein
MTSSTTANERGAGSATASLPDPVLAAAFWLAVLLPFCSLAVLAGGFASVTSPAFVSLLAVNVVALVVGHGYRR